MEDIERFAAVRLAAGTLYAAITRLEKQGWIRPVPLEDRRQPYCITAAERNASKSKPRPWMAYQDGGARVETRMRGLDQAGRTSPIREHGASGTTPGFRLCWTIWTPGGATSSIRRDEQSSCNRHCKQRIYDGRARWLWPAPHQRQFRPLIAGVE